MSIGCVGAPLRELKFAGGMPGSFEGYGAVFGNADSHGDVIERGAFRKSLDDRQARGRRLPSMFKMHGAATLNQHEPIGVWDEMREDGKGLFVAGHLIGLDTEAGRWTYAQLREGALRGLSIGYRVPPNGATRGGAGGASRAIRQLDLFEVSLVDEPSNALATVSSVKRAIDRPALADDITSLREFEEFLRDFGGFSHSSAKAIAADGFRQPDADVATAIRRTLGDLADVWRH